MKLEMELFVQWWIYELYVQKSNHMCYSLVPCSLLVAVLAYIVIGLLVNRFYRGARGLEMIPHLSFWKDFPYLLKVP